MDTDPKKESKSLQDKVQKAMDEFKTNEKLDNLYNFARENTKDTVAYIILFSGILISIFNTFIGGSLIGLITGFYFTPEILTFYDNFQDFVDEYGVFRTFILGGATLGLFIALPSFFLAVVIAVGIMLLFGEKIGTKKSEKEEEKEEEIQ